MEVSLIVFAPLFNTHNANLDLHTHKGLIELNEFQFLLNNEGDSHNFPLNSPP